MFWTILLPSLSLAWLTFYSSGQSFRISGLFTQVVAQVAFAVAALSSWTVAVYRDSNLAPKAVQSSSQEESCS